MSSRSSKQRPGDESGPYRQGCVHVMREEFRCSSLGLSHPNPRLLVSDQWGFPVLYVCWRVMCAMYHTAWIVYNWVTDWQTNDRVGTWAVYLTNWSFLLLTINTIVQAVVVVFVHYTAPDFRDGQTRWYMKAAWILYEIASVAALLVTILYFALLFHGSLPLMGGVHHLGNSVYVVLDFLITAMPVRLLHVIYAAIYATVYLLFSVIYWAAGGVNSDGYSYIYKSLDWDTAESAAPLAIGTVVVGVPLFYLIFWSLYMVRVAIHRQCCVEERENDSTQMRETRGGGESKSTDVDKS